MALENRKSSLLSNCLQVNQTIKFEGGLGVLWPSIAGLAESTLNDSRTKAPDNIATKWAKSRSQCE